jgi:hypothetical protein
MFHSPVVGRMRGPDDREYSYFIETLSGTDDGKLTVRFWMRDADAGSGQYAAAGGARSASPSTGTLSETARAEYSRQLYEAQKERDEAEIQMRRAKQRHEVGVTPESEVESATKRAQLARNRAEDIERTLNGGSRTVAPVARPNVVDSTFAIAIGETVVIGTSRLKGDQALIALLTAAGKPTAAR